MAIPSIFESFFTSIKVYLSSEFYVFGRVNTGNLSIIPKFSGQDGEVFHRHVPTITPCWILDLAFSQEH